MTKEEIINLANRCSQKIWEICMEEPGFSTNDCPEGANGLSDIVLNVILKAFPATKECSSLPSNLDEAANSYSSKTECAVVARRGFKAGAEWMAGQGETFETTMQEDDVDELVPTCPNMYNHGYSCGDRVIVQIRKKQ